jgi:hypothetical protein
MLRFSLRFLTVSAAVVLSADREAPRLMLSCETFPPAVSLAEVQASFSVHDVAMDSLGVEGEMMPATVLFPADRRRRLEIVWKDSVAQRRPRFVYLAVGPTQWRTADGITVGTSLRQLERLNGRPFRLAGFGFDGSGIVGSWNGGRLATAASASCQRRVFVGALTAAAEESKPYRMVRGDHEFWSSNPAMQKLNPRVSLLRLEYP